jgi:glutamate racemase
MIGFFDSGIGGLTISEKVRELLPRYDTLYLGDAANAPYGGKSHKELVDLTWAGTEWLFKQGCHLVIIACNSASASALREIQQTKLGDYPGYRVLGIVRPTVEFLAQQNFHDVLILSTEATEKSGAYVAELKKLNPDIRITSQACPRWAPMIEAGLAGTSEMREEVECTLTGVSRKHDAALLACTHYPYVKDDVKATLGAKMQVHNQGKLVAESLRDYLARHTDIESRLEQTNRHDYFTTGDAHQAQKIAQRFGFKVNFSQKDTF